VSFPSFHAASAVLYMWALWPVRGIGGVAAALDLLMIAAAPVTGAHYMIDVFGGVALAAISIFLGKYFLDALAPSSPAA
jgi:membrane-associated phospholipid phosphatase